MSTNYHRIPKWSEIRRKYLILSEQIDALDIWNLEDIRNDFRTIERGFDNLSPWDVYLDGMRIHVGKRSKGWRFLWNFQDGKYYNSKEELLKFIRSGRIIDEYGELQDTEEFIKMSLEWGQPDGNILNKDYFDEQKKLTHYRPFTDMSNYYDKDIDGLRVSSHSEFS
jgi:hypothetical protein